MFDKLYYKGKEVKPKKPKLIALILEMPKKPKGYKTIFPISFGCGERTNIIVENHPRIKKIIVYASAKEVKK